MTHRDGRPHRRSTVSGYESAFLKLAIRSPLKDPRSPSATLSTAVIGGFAPGATVPSWGHFIDQQVRGPFKSAFSTARRRRAAQPDVERLVVVAPRLGVTRPTVLRMFLCPAVRFRHLLSEALGIFLFAVVVVSHGRVPSLHDPNLCRCFWRICRQSDRSPYTGTNPSKTKQHVANNQECVPIIEVRHRSVVRLQPR